MSPGLGHPASTSSFTSAKQGALPPRSCTAQYAPLLVVLGSGAGGGWPISGS